MERSTAACASHRPIPRQTGVDPETGAPSLQVRRGQGGTSTMAEVTSSSRCRVSSTTVSAAWPGGSTAGIHVYHRRALAGGDLAADVGRVSGQRTCEKNEYHSLHGTVLLFSSLVNCKTFPGSINEFQSHNCRIHPEGAERFLQSGRGVGDHLDRKST